MTPLNQIPYIYFKGGDKLTNFGGEKFKYDNLGNPTLYRDTKYDWNMVRNLVSIDNCRIKFNYDENGIRTHKHEGDNTVEYFYQDGKLLAERHTEQISDLYCGDELPNSEHEPAHCGTVETKYITYLYGVDGISGFTLEQNGETRRYYYQKNTWAIF